MQIKYSQLTRMSFNTLIGALALFSLTITPQSYAADLVESQALQSNPESSPLAPINKIDILGSPNNQYQSVNNLQGGKYPASPAAIAPDNSAAVEAEQLEIDKLKGEYISPYNYTQDPIAYNMGTTSVAGPNGTYHGGISSISSANINLAGQNKGVFSDTAEVWGQTQRWGGFALGGGLTGSVSPVQTGQPNTFGTTGLIIPSQAYVDWEYKDIFEFTAGNVILTNPWVNSISSYPGATYANSNNPFQAVQANVQVNDSLLLTGFQAFTYQQYPNNWFNYQTLYNSNAGFLNGLAQTSGATGVGATWNPTNNYNFNLWYYNFIGQANMYYFDNHLHTAIATNISMDFGIQYLNQGSSGDVFTSSTYTNLQGQTVQTQAVQSNAVGAEWAINTGDNTLLVAYNNVFGNSNSYMNGAMITPYTYGLETDPLYTTPALSSLAELGSGSAYLIKDTMHFLNSSLKASLAFSQFFINQVYATQTGMQTEYDAALQYSMPHTHLNLWGRVVYVQQADNAGGDFIQPRFIMNWTF